MVLRNITIISREIFRRASISVLFLLVAVSLGLSAPHLLSAAELSSGGSGRAGDRPQRANSAPRPVPPAPIGIINVLILSNWGEALAAADFSASIPNVNFYSLNVGSYVPVPADFANVDVVLLFEDGLMNNTVNVGNAVYNFQQSGGGVLLATFVWQDWSNNTAFSGVGFGNLESISPLTSDTVGCEYVPDTMGTVLLPAHPIMNGVNSLYAPSYRGGTQLSPVGTAIALWSTTNAGLGTADPLVAIYEPPVGGRVAAISMIPHYGYYAGFTGDFYRLFENTMNWAAFVGSSHLCDVAMSAASYSTGVDVIASTVRFTSWKDSMIDINIWLTPSSGSSLPLMENSNIMVPAGFDLDIGPQTLFTVDPLINPPGTYSLNCRAVEAVTGILLTEDTTTFNIVP